MGHDGLDRPDAETSAGHDLSPVDPGNGDVLAGGACLDGMALILESFDHFQREEAEGLVRASMVNLVRLLVADDPMLVDHRFMHGELGHSALAGVDLMDPTHRQSLGRAPILEP